MLHEGPGTQPAMQLRVARHTERLQEVVECYRDGIGLTQIGGFRDHDGYDGVFLAVPRPLESRSLRLLVPEELALEGVTELLV
jgi:YycE-like protein